MKKTMLAVYLMLAGGAAQAVPLAVGNNPLSGTTVAAQPQLAGTVVVDEVTPFVFATAGGTFSGNVQNRVVKSIDGTYDFYWQIRDTSFSGPTPFDIQEFRVGQFGTSVIGVNGDFETDGQGDVGPDNAYVFAPPEQNFVDFLFGNGLDAGQTSYFMFLDTDATAFSKNAIYDFGREGSTQISGLYATYGPASVPEPASWVTMVTGFGLLGAAMRRRLRLAPA